METKGGHRSSLEEKENLEWLELVLLAMRSGASKEQFRIFLENEIQKQGVTK